MKKFYFFTLLFLFTFSFAYTQPDCSAFHVSLTSTPDTGYAGVIHFGTATAHADHGTAPYTYSWSPIGGTDSIATGLPGGVYTVTVEDSNGCNRTKEITVIQPIMIRITGSPRICVDTPLIGNDFIATIQIPDSILIPSYDSLYLGIERINDITFTDGVPDSNYQVYSIGRCPTSDSCLITIHFHINYGCSYPQFDSIGRLLPIPQHFVLYNYDGSNFTPYDSNYVAWNFTTTFRGHQQNFSAVVGQNPDSISYYIDYYKLVELPGSRTIYGHADETIHRDIVLLNTGTIPFDGDFSFDDVFACSVMHIDTIEIFDSTASIHVFPDTTVFSYNFSGQPIDTLQELTIRETIGISFNEDTCLSDTDCHQSSITYRWGCCSTSNIPDTNYTISLDSTWNLQWTQQYPSPSLPCGYWDANCQDSLPFPWQYVVENTGGASAYNVKITLQNTQLSSFYFIDTNNVILTYIPNPVSGNPSQVFHWYDTSQVTTVVIDSTIAHLDCAVFGSSILSIVFGNDSNAIPALHPGDKYEIDFRPVFCCPANDNDDNNGFINLLLNPAKYFNSWQLIAHATDECNGHPHAVSPALSSNTCQNSPPINIPGDLAFTQDLTPSVSNLVSTNGGCDTTNTANIEIDNTQFIMRPEDANLFCSTYNNDPDSMPMTANIKLRFRMSPNLNMDNLLDTSHIYIQKGSMKWNFTSDTVIHDVNCPVSSSDERVYDVIFRGTDLDTGLTLRRFSDFMNGSGIYFSFNPCCCYTADLHSPYFVETYISGTCQDTSGHPCWIPIGVQGKYINVMCPGCVFPGIQVDDSQFKRKNFGFIDDDNDGLADTAIATNDSHPGVKNNRSIQGDTLEATVTGTYYGGGGNGGMEYSDMVALNCTSCTNPFLGFEHLYFDQTIPFSNVNDFNLTLLSSDVYLNNDTIADLSLDSAAISSINATHESNPPPTENQFLFHFIPSDLGIPDFSPSSFGPIKIVNKYRVCKNKVVSDQDAEHNKFESETFNDFYFSIIPTTTSVFDSLVQAGDSCINDTTCSCLCNKIFQCGTGGNFHYFYSIHTDNISIFYDYLHNGAECHKAIFCKALSDIGGVTNNDAQYGLGLNVFPYEYRPAPPMHEFKVTIPTGYSFASVQSIPPSLTTEFCTYACSLSVGTLNNYAGDTVTITPLFNMFSMNVSTTIANETMRTVLGCNYDNQINSPFGNVQGDEFTRTSLYFEVVPDCHTTDSITCIPPSTVDEVFDDYSQCTSSPETLDVYRSCPPDSNCSGGYSCASFTNPNPLISYDATTISVEAVADTFTQTFRFNEVYPPYTENAFIYFPYSPHFTITGISPSGTIAGIPGVYTLCELGYVAGSPDDFQITFRLNTCDHDPIIFYWGWNCDGYPDSANIFNSCFVSGPDSVHYTMATVEVSGQMPTDSSYSFCEDKTFEVTIQNHNIGQFENVQVSLDLPPFLSLIDTTTAQYCHTSVCIPTTVTTSGVPPNYLFSLPDTLQAGDYLTLTFHVHIDCGYAGDPPVVTYTYQKYCSAVSELPSENLFTSWTYSGNDLCTPHCLTAFIGNDTAICITQSDTLYANATGGYPPYTYSWMPTGDTTASIIVSPSSTTIYLVTVTDSIGQTYTAKIKIGVDECFCTIADTIIADSTYSSSIGSGISNKSVIIQGRFYVDTNFYFDTCSVHLWANAEIDILNNSTLTIDSSHLFACGDTMWTGIVMYDTSKIVINNSIVEDAITTIYADGFNTASTIISIDSSLFDHNYVGLYARNIDLTGVCNISNSIFQCSGGISKEPYNGGNTSAHILLDQATMKVGDETAADYNYFYDADYGVLSRAGTVTAYHNQFKNLGNYSYDPSFGGIYANYWFNRPSFITVGSELTPPAGTVYDNYFIDCFNGIYNSAGAETNIFKNSFNGCITGTEVEKITTGHTPATITPVDIRANDYKDCTNGILLFDVVKTRLEVDSNRITSPYDKNDIPYGKYGIAMINSDLAADTLRMNVNSIDDYNYCMFLLNVATKSAWFEVGNNTITFNFDSLHLGGNLYRGIRMENCQAAKVFENNVTWNSGMTDPNAINAYADSLQGIRVESVKGSVYSCNDVVTCGSGMFIQDKCPGTYLSYNTLDNNYPGMKFSLVSLPNQGDTASPAGNEWYGTYTSTNGRVAGTGVGLFNYYYNTASQFPQPPILSFIFAIPTGPGSGNPCSSVEPADTTKKDKELAAIIDSTDNSDSTADFAAEAKYNKKDYAYQSMKALPELINTAARSYFMDTTAEASMGVLVEVKDLMANGDTLQASGVNASVATSNLIETNKKTVNDIYLSTIDTLSSADSATLNAIAYQPAITGGEAVYWTRGRLRLSIEDNYSASQRRSKNVLKDSDNSSLVSVYPNPTNEKINIVSNSGIIQYLNIENIMGEQVLFKTIKSDRSTIDVSTLSNGTYVLRISLEDKNEIRRKLTVIH